MSGQRHTARHTTTPREGTPEQPEMAPPTVPKSGNSKSSTKQAAKGKPTATPKQPRQTQQQTPQPPSPPVNGDGTIAVPLTPEQELEYKEFLELIPEDMINTMSSASDHTQWKGAARALSAQLLMIAGGLPLQLRDYIFQHIKSKALCITAESKRDISNYWHGQFNTTLVQYENDIKVEVSKLFTETEGGKQALADLQEYLDTHNGEKAVLLREFVPFKTPKDLLVYKGKPGIPFTRYKLVALKLRPLLCLDREWSPKNTVNWIANDPEGQFEELCAENVLRDICSYIQLKGLATSVSILYTISPTALVDAFWANRINAVADGIQLPAIAMLEDKPGCFRHHFNKKGSQPSPWDEMTNKGNSCHFYCSYALSNPPVSKEDHPDFDFGNGSRDEPFKRDEMFSSSREEPDDDELEDVTDEERFADRNPDSMLAEYPDYADTLHSRYDGKAVDTANGIVDRLEAGDVIHPYIGNGFHTLVDFINISTRPAYAHESQIAKLFASCNYEGMVGILTTLGRHNLAVHSEIAKTLQQQCKDMELEFKKLKAVADKSKESRSYIDRLCTKKRKTRESIRNLQDKVESTRKAKSLFDEVETVEDEDTVSNQDESDYDDEDVPMHDDGGEGLTSNEKEIMDKAVAAAAAAAQQSIRAAREQRAIAADKKRKRDSSTRPQGSSPAVNPQIPKQGRAQDRQATTPRKDLKQIPKPAFDRKSIGQNIDLTGDKTNLGKNSCKSIGSSSSTVNRLSGIFNNGGVASKGDSDVEITYAKSVGGGNSQRPIKKSKRSLESSLDSATRRPPSLPQSQIPLLTTDEINNLFEGISDGDLNFTDGDQTDTKAKEAGSSEEQRDGHDADDNGGTADEESDEDDLPRLKGKHNGKDNELHADEKEAVRESSPFQALSNSVGAGGNQ